MNPGDVYRHEPDGRVQIIRVYPEGVVVVGLGAYSERYKTPAASLVEYLGTTCSMCSGDGRRQLHPEAAARRIDGATTARCEQCEGRGWEHTRAALGKGEED